MTFPGDRPLLRIGEPIRRLGVSDHVLRARGNRYGLPQPACSPGGLRLQQPGRCPVSLLEVSTGARDLGAVVVLAGEADPPIVTQLNEVLNAQVSPRTRYMTTDSTNLRCIDQTTAQAFMLAALIVLVQGGRVVLVNSQELVLR